MSDPAYQQALYRVIASVEALKEAIKSLQKQADANQGAIHGTPASVEHSLAFRIRRMEEQLEGVYKILSEKKEETSKRTLAWYGAFVAVVSGVLTKILSAFF